MWTTRVATAAAVLVVGGSAGLGVASADPIMPSPAVPSPAPPAAPKTSMDADGTYAVGSDIVPGVYTSAGPVGDGKCYWKRAANPDGSTIDSTMSGKPQVAQIDAGDLSFTTNGCQQWQLTDGVSPPADSLSPLLEGLKWRALMAELNARAAQSGQLSPP